MRVLVEVGRKEKQSPSSNSPKLNLIARLAAYISNAIHRQQTPFDPEQGTTSFLET